jgi:hypothetical protein
MFAEGVLYELASAPQFGRTVNDEFGHVAHLIGEEHYIECHTFPHAQ